MSSIKAFWKLTKHPLELRRLVDPKAAFCSCAGKLREGNLQQPSNQ